MLMLAALIGSVAPVAARAAVQVSSLPADPHASVRPGAPSHRDLRAVRRYGELLELPDVVR